MGYDYEIQYRQGNENLAADGLSRLYGAQLLTLAIITISLDLLVSIKHSWTQDPTIQQLIQTLSIGQLHPKYL